MLIYYIICKITLFVPSVNNKSSKITLTNIKKIAMLIMLLVDNFKMRKQLSGRAAPCEGEKQAQLSFSAP